MNKGDIIEGVANKTGYPKTAVTEILNIAIDKIAKAAKKEIVILLGLGTFKPARRKARVGVNPSTGKKIKIPAYKTVKFTPAANIKKFK
ncbi:HU family DNA-binding protein [Candidatus Woesearchaeota archaeon]|nr:HU family DNA-binding protein [Candidatus Woesearchaeota archaeon]